MGGFFLLHHATSKPRKFDPRQDTEASVRVRARLHLLLPSHQVIGLLRSREFVLVCNLKGEDFAVSMLLDCTDRVCRAIAVELQSARRPFTTICKLSLIVQNSRRFGHGSLGDLTDFISQDSLPLRGGAKVFNT
eukprot:TRINITY_DN888_c0_g1_i9.p1 TRINITY_DN888_c0_g1~~TRINITY_DN888_c0_g1_i9.p1  ORF type:complete len:134 (+),score=16.62 TRINITY_DN888_c0_g1_i9:371-772(+)